jgi:hypothetical protein
MEKEFVPYEQAVALKELGFEEDCFGYYDVDNGYATGYAFCYSNVKSQLESGCSAPLYQQAFRWLHEQLNMKGVMPTTDLEYRLQMLNNLIKMLSSKKKKYG